jgi:hypothetical protein
MIRGFGARLRPSDIVLFGVASGGDHPLAESPQASALGASLGRLNPFSAIRSAERAGSMR